MGAQIAVRDQQLNGIFLACNRSAVHRRPVPVVFGIAIGTMGNKELYHVSRRFDGRDMQRRVAVSIFGIDICSARKKHFDEFRISCPVQRRLPLHDVALHGFFHISTLSNEHLGNIHLVAIEGVNKQRSAIRGLAIDVNAFG